MAKASSGIVLMFALCVFPVELVWAQQQKKVSKSFPVYWFKEFPTNTLLTWYTSMLSKRDSQVDTPTRFQILLPKGMQRWRISNNSEFEFFYPKGQIIFIETFYNQLNKNRDSSYTPTRDDVEEFFSTQTIDSVTLGNADLNIKRFNMIVRTKHANYLFYNILKADQKDFLKSIRTFRKL